MTPVFRFVLLVFLVAPGWGLLPAQAKDSANGFNWLTPAQEQSIIDSLPPSPAPDSPYDQGDLAAVLKAQAARTPAEAAQVLAEANFSPKLFQAELGPGFNQEHEPKIFSLVGKACGDVGAADRDAKAKWQRPRPFRAHKEVHPVYEATGLSYPSGHAATAYICAVILGEIFPDEKQALLDHAAEIAQDRVIGGVHYPSDIAAGEKLGRAVAKALLANAAFQESLAAAKAEAPAPAGK